MTDEERLERVKQEMDEAEKGYAEECVKLFNTKGYDEYSRKWQKKLDKIADKYSRIIYPLKEEYNELCDIINEAEEEKRKSQYKGSYSE